MKIVSTVAFAMLFLPSVNPTAIFSQEKISAQAQTKMRQAIFINMFGIENSQKTSRFFQIQKKVISPEH